MSNPFLSHQDTKVIYEALPEFSFKWINCCILYNGQKTSDYLQSFIPSIGHSLYTNDKNVLTVFTDTATITAATGRFDAINSFGQSVIQNVLSTWIKGSIKIRIVKILKENNNFIASTSLLFEINKFLRFVSDVQIARVLSEMKEDKTIDYIEASFGELSLPYGMIELIDLEA
jgi:hypothetical protein